MEKKQSLDEQSFGRQNLGAIEKNSLRDPQQAVSLIKQILEDKKVEQINVISLHDRPTIFESFIIGTCLSVRQIWAVAHDLEQTLKPLGCQTIVEGDPSSDWLVVDAGGILVHLFKPESRAYYDLDNIWGSVLTAEQLAALKATSFE